MKRSMLLVSGIVVALLVVGARPTDAAKTELRVTPDNLKHVEGLTIDAERREGGRVRFMIRRDVAKARWQLRTGDLEVGGGAGAAGPVIECAVEGRKRPGGIVEYRFTLSANAVEDARFTLREVQGSEADDIQLIGGGEFYAIQLADFAPNAR